MKHRIKVDVVTQKKGLFGTREVVQRRTVTVSGKEYRRLQREKQNAVAKNEAQHLAGLFLVGEEDIAEEYGEDW